MSGSAEATVSVTAPTRERPRRESRDVVDVARPVEEVFAFMAQPENVPRYSPIVTEARRATSGPIALGSTAVLVCWILGLKGTETIDHELLQRVRTRERGHRGSLADLRIRSPGAEGEDPAARQALGGRGRSGAGSPCSGRRPGAETGDQDLGPGVRRRMLLPGVAKLR